MSEHSYTSIEHIIEDVYRETQLKEEVDINDVIEWVGDAIKLIGVPANLQDKVAKITVKEGIGKLPCDLYQLIQVRDYDTKTPLREASNTFHRHFKRDDSTNDTNITIGEGLYANDAFEDIKGVVDKDVSDQYAGGTTFPSYQINEDYIFPNYLSDNDGNDVNLEMAYKAFPVSETGLPKIPDNIRTKQAVKWYIIHRLDYVLWRRGDIPDKVYTEDKKEKDWYMAKAQVRIPSIDEMEKLKNNHVRLIPKINQWDDFFEELGNPELRHTHNSTKGGTTGYGENSRRL